MKNSKQFIKSCSSKFNSSKLSSFSIYTVATVWCKYCNCSLSVVTGFAKRWLVHTHNINVHTSPALKEYSNRLTVQVYIIAKSTTACFYCRDGEIHFILVRQNTSIMWCISLLGVFLEQGKLIPWDWIWWHFAWLFATY